MGFILFFNLLSPQLLLWAFPSFPSAPMLSSVASAASQRDWRQTITAWLFLLFSVSGTGCYPRLCVAQLPNPWALQHPAGCGCRRGPQGQGPGSPGSSTRWSAGMSTALPGSRAACWPEPNPHSGSPLPESLTSCSWHQQPPPPPPQTDPEPGEKVP